MQFIKKHKKKILLSLLFLLGIAVGVCALFPSEAHAAWWEFWKPSGDDEKAAADFLGKYGSYLQYSDNPIKSMLHTLGWGTVTLFYHIVTLIEDCLDGANLLSLFSFVDGKNATIHGIYGSVMTVVVWSVLALSLVLVGYKLMVGKQSDLKNLTVNIFLSIWLLVLMPTLFGVGQYSGEAFSRGLFNDVKALNTDKKSDESLAFGLIKQNTTDWAYVSQKNKWDDVKKGKNVNQLDENDFSAGVYPLSNLITAKSAKELDTKQGKLLQYHLSKNDDNKTKPVKDSSVASWAPKSFQNGYFQYTLTSTIGVLIGLAALAVAVLFNAFVIVRAIVELAMKRILAPVIFASDIETLQKSKMILSDIMKCYLTIGLTELGMVLFNFWVTYVNGKNMNLLLKVVCFVAGVSFLINGSTSVQRYFGIDIGLQDGKNGMMAAFGVGAAIGKGSKAVKGTAGAGIAAIAGGAAGIMNGLQKGAGMKLSQSAAGSAGGSSATAGSQQESLSERQNQQRHQDSKQKPESTNIQARRPSLARRAARATGQKIQQSAERQMQKHPGAAKLGNVAGTAAGGTAGLAARGVKKLSGLDQQSAGSQQTGGTTVKNASQARSDAVKVGKPVNNVNNDPLKRPDSSLSEKQEHQQTEVRQEQEKPQEQLQEDYRQVETQQEQGNPETEALSQRQPEQKQENPQAQQAEVQQQNQQPQAKEDHQPETREQQSVSQQAETPQEAVQAEATQTQQLQERQSKPSQQEVQAQERQEATSVSQPKKATQTQQVVQQPQEAVQTQQVVQQEVTPAGTHDYSQIINGGSGSPTTTVQKRKHPGTPPTKPDDNVLKNPWGDIQNDRSR